MNNDLNARETDQFQISSGYAASLDAFRTQYFCENLVIRQPIPALFEAVRLALLVVTFLKGFGKPIETARLRYAEPSTDTEPATLF